MKKITSRYLQGIDGTKFYSMLTYFWLANRKQHVRKSRTSIKENGSPLFITSLRCCNELGDHNMVELGDRSDFSSAPITRQAQRR